MSLQRKARKETYCYNYTIFYKIMSVPQLLYGSETQIMSGSDEARLKASEMNFLRLVTGYKKMNTALRKELKLFNLNNRIKKSKNKWTPYVHRMQRVRLSFILRNHRPLEKRSIECPRKRWAVKCRSNRQMCLKRED